MNTLNEKRNLLAQKYTAPKMADDFGCEFTTAMRQELKAIDAAYKKLADEGYIVGDYDCGNWITLRRHEDDEPLYIDIRAALRGAKPFAEAIVDGWNRGKFNKPIRGEWTAAEMAELPGVYEMGLDLIAEGHGEEAMQMFEEEDMIGWADTVSLIKQIKREKIQRLKAERAAAKAAKAARAVVGKVTSTRTLAFLDAEIEAAEADYEAFVRLEEEHNGVVRYLLDLGEDFDFGTPAKRERIAKTKQTRSDTLCTQLDLFGDCDAFAVA